MNSSTDRTWKIHGTRHGLGIQLQVEAVDFDSAVRIASMKHMMVVNEVRLVDQKIKNNFPFPS